MSEFSETFFSLMEEKKFSEALERAELELLQTDGSIEAARIHHMAGNAAWYGGRPDISTRHYAAASSRLGDDDDPTLRFVVLSDYGLVLFDAGRRDEALEQYDLAEEVDPGTNPTATRTLSRRRAALLLDESRHREAEAALGPRPDGGASKGEDFAWLNYKLLLAERTGDIDAAQVLATEVRDVWDAHGDEPEIFEKIGAMLSALRVDAILRGEPFVRDAIETLAAHDGSGLSLTARSRLDLLRIELLQANGATDAALDRIDQAIRTFVDVHDHLPLDFVTARWDILHQAGREDEFISSLDDMSDGHLLSGDFPLEDLTNETCPLLLAILQSPGLKDQQPRLFERGTKRLLELVFEDMDAEVYWRATALLGSVLDVPASQIFFSKLACAALARTSATAIDFPASRRTFLRDRVAPFENAVSLLYGAGRLHEGRELAALATDMRHEATVSLGRRAPQPEIVPWTVSEQAVLDLLANDRAAALEGLRNGSVWPRTPAKPLQDRTSSSDKPILRYPKAAQGYLVDCQTGTAARRTAVTATEAELATWIADLLDAAERGEVDEVSRAALFQALLGEVYDLVRSAAAVSVLPDGVIASIPFDLLCTEDPRPRFVYLPGNAAPRVAHSAGNRATLLIGDPDLQGTQAEAAALAAAAELTQEPLTVASLMEALSDPPKLLHISGHFQAVPGDASASAFLLATGETIELRDLAQLIDGVGDVAPELVFLSLCDSALQEATPEAAIDLPSLFLTLGARAVIGAAWKIADYDAAPFAVAFYTALAQGEEVPGAFATAMSKTGFRGFKLFQSEPL